MALSLAPHMSNMMANATNPAAMAPPSGRVSVEPGHAMWQHQRACSGGEVRQREDHQASSQASLTNPDGVVARAQSLSTPR